ncbi:MAG TPA: pantoate--beta-alanine ligase [Candidatus Hydrogenedentes bacterium]|nr:pantoate--beta-alanine ligase [Candidatus Hydrogenedentota bacterium]HOV72621.1 pantoate--beta-alanine ligase [Candidatus Hydrogenedentota bacterium]HPC16507.1 pantoate--beta-alanine ligase [Candidatus Hydrogenedentota bacterium]HRT21607.1 pantoate--beta-alanine ligase [Candidatus Hydrogenedentota bacterium]HRT63252.1 pantoate--beta-alanine ligase [Candidatus Hydrogenedentota bacterium]
MKNEARVTPTILDTPGAMRAWSLAQRAEGKTIGFVPTMGALHEGHASLMRAAARENDRAVLSIFVNPTQFAPHEDFNQYPRTFDADLKLAEETGMDIIYAPRASTMYPEHYSTYVIVEEISEGLCGGSRPHFFRGVATVVTKLFNAVLPHRAYFGQKDAQQCAVIKRMTRNLDMGIEIVEMPIVRDPDGLAMSSRNAYLSPEERQRGLCLSRSLFAARELIQAGERNAKKIINHVRAGMAEVQIDYVELVDANTMKPLEHIEGTMLLAVAAWVGKTRLIDNIKCEV